MKLSVVDRIILLNVLPTTGTVVNLRVISDVKQKLGFTEDEHKVLNFQPSPDGTGTVWEQGTGEAEIEIGPKAFSLIVDAFEKLNSAQKMTTEYLPTYDKFITEG